MTEEEKTGVKEIPVETPVKETPKEEVKAPESAKEKAPVEEKKVTEEKPKEAIKEDPKEIKAETPKEVKAESIKEVKTEEKPVKSDKAKSTVVVSDATPAQVVKVFRKVGLYGECYQVLARVLEGRDKGNLLRRNIRGPVKENDLIMLKETERDVRAV